MSAEPPSSVSTSSDPRSRRPTKKRALTPNSAQAASVDALFAKPDQDIRIPLSSADQAAKRRVAATGNPEIIANVQGSSAGAGSGEFHVYKAARRREYERLRAMDEELKAEKAEEDFERTRAEKAARDEEKTRKNRDKREKRKKQKGKKMDAGKQGAGAAATSSGGVAKRQVTRNEEGKDEDNKTSGQDVTEVGANGQGQFAVPSSTEPMGLVIHDDD